MDDSAAPSCDPFEVAPDPMAMFAPDGTLLRVNAAYAEVFRQKVSAKRPPWGRVEPPPFENGVRTFEAATPDGRKLEWRERLLGDGSRLAMARDISERARAADEAGRAKTVLFATLTHELRTPLNGVIGMAGLLQKSPLDPSQRQFVNSIAECGDHLLSLISDILDYSRLEAGRLQLDAADFDPEDTARAIVELLSPKARAKGLEMALRAAPATPARVRGDEGRLRQILFNLAGNAVKFTEEGGVTVEIAPGPRKAGDQVWLRVIVRDTGPGVAEDKQALIFEEFAQADASTQRRFGGAGLGLAIVRRLARAMGGVVSLQSRPGAGAAFLVDLPFEAAQSAPLLPPPARLDGVVLALATPSAVLGGALSDMAEGLGARVRRVLAPEGARGAAALLLDQAAQWAPDYASLPATPVILLIPQEDRAAIEAAKAQGLAYLPKPVRRHALAERVRAALGREPATAKPAMIEASEAAPSAGLRVLLAEDNPVNALLARTLLARFGCSCEVAGDGEQAAEAAKDGEYDLILMDLRMPGLGGFGAARRIRALPDPRGRTPIVALTADAGEEERAAARAVGMDRFLTKPIEPHALEALLMDLSRAKGCATFARG